MMVIKIEGENNNFAPHDEMISYIIEILKEKGECTEKDLYGKFTPDVIERHWPLSHALAKVKLNWMDA